MLKKSFILCLLLIISTALIFAGGKKEEVIVEKDTYPDKSVTCIVAFSPGGESDITARLQQPFFEEITGQKLIITYKEGGGGAVGWADLVRQKPDGYTIAGVNEPHSIVQPLMRDDAGFKTEELVRIGQFQYTPRVFMVKKDSPYKSMEDLLEYARKNPEKVTIGGTGTWSSSHIANLMLMKRSNSKMTYIPYSGAATLKAGLLGGHVMIANANVTQAIELGDEVRVLGVCGEKRNIKLPEIPTMRELGYDIIEGSFRGVVAPPGTPPEIVNKLADIFKQINEHPQFVAKMEEMGFDLLWRGPAEYDKFIKENIEHYRSILDEFGYKK